MPFELHFTGKSYKKGNYPFADASAFSLSHVALTYSQLTVLQYLFLLTSFFIIALTICTCVGLNTPRQSVINIPRIYDMQQFSFKGCVHFLKQITTGRSLLLIAKLTLSSIIMFIFFILKTVTLLSIGQDWYRLRLIHINEYYVVHVAVIFPRS